MRGDVFRQQLAVGAGDYRAVVLAVAADIDEGYAGGAFYGADGLHGYAGSAEGRFQGGAEIVVADISQHAYRVAELRDAYGLIGAFAAVECAEVFAGDGFAGEGDVIGGGDEIEIDAAYDYYWLTHFV